MPDRPTAFSYGYKYNKSASCLYMTIQHNYWFADFVIRSEVPLPDLWPAVRLNNDADGVTIRRGKVTDLAETDCASPIQRGVCYQCTIDEFVLKTPVATFLIRKGREVIFEPLRGKPEQDMRPFMSGPMMAILCYQRGLFILHGCALQFQDRAILLCGISGSGKSTIAYGLIKQGWELLTDDVVPFKKVDGKLFPLPGKRYLYLWEDTVQYFRLPLSELPRVRSELQKYVVNAGSSPYPPAGGTPLSAIVVLSRSVTPVVNDLEAVTAVEAFDLLLKHGTYRSQWIETLQLGRTWFDFCSQAIRSSDIYRLCLLQKKKFLPDVIGQLINMLP